MKKNKKNIKSSRLSIKFANKEKQKEVETLVDTYKETVQKYVDILWDIKDLPKFLGEEIYSQVKTNISVRLKQCAAKQAKGVVQGTRAKQERRLWKINDFIDKGMFKKARKLQKIYDEAKVSHPEIKTIECELDSRFILQDFENETSFDGWITVSSIGDRKKIIIPVKSSKHFNKLFKKGKLLAGIRLSKKEISFNFDMPKVEKKQKGKTLGIDVGKVDTISCSNNFQTKENNHGQTLNTIINDLSKKKKGSKAFERKQTHRTNFINWSINQLNLNDFKQVNIEKIMNLRKGKKTSRKLQGWTYTNIFNKLKDYCLEHGVHVKEIDPTYTSQRCSVCGRVRKANRKGKLFKCDHCNNVMDADLNASRNISFNLPSIPKEIRLKQLNRKGFFWLKEGFYFDALGQEPIIPVTRKTKCTKK